MEEGAELWSTGGLTNPYDAKCNKMMLNNTYFLQVHFCHAWEHFIPSVQLYSSLLKCFKGISKLSEIMEKQG